MRLALLVRRALLEEPELARANLGVRVRDGVVTLWGPIPSVELGRRAVARARKVAGVREVRNDLYVNTTPQEPPSIRFPTEPEPPSATESASPDPATGTLGKVTGRTPLIALPPSGRTATPQTPPPAASPSTVDSATTPPQPAPSSPLPSTGRSAPAPAPAGVLLMAPVGAPGARPPVHPRPQATAPPSLDLAQSVERLQQSEPRFHRVRVEVQGDAVFIGAPDDVPGEAVMALAQALSRMPGVGRVVLRSPTAGPH
jgi:hypothetical protein